MSKHDDLPLDIEAALMEGAQMEHDFYRVRPEDKTMAKWIAEGATVLEEGGEADNVICYTWEHGKRRFYGGEPPDAPAHRMAQTIADEHNERQALLSVIKDLTEALHKAVTDKHDLEDRVQELRSMLDASRARAGLEGLG